VKLSDACRGGRPGVLAALEEKKSVAAGREISISQNPYQKTGSLTF